MLRSRQRLPLGASTCVSQVRGHARSDVYSPTYAAAAAYEGPCAAAPALAAPLPFPLLARARDRTPPPSTGIVIVADVEKHRLAAPHLRSSPPRRPPWARAWAELISRFVEQRRNPSHNRPLPTSQRVRSPSLPSTLNYLRTQHLTAERSRTLARSTPSGCGPRQAAGGATRPTGSATRRSAAQCGVSASTSPPGSRWRMSVGRSRPCRTRCRRSSGASTPSPTTRGSRPWAGPTRRRSERATRAGVFDASAHILLAQQSCYF